MPPSRISDRVYTRKSQSYGKGEWKKGGKRCLTMFIARDRRCGYFANRTVFESPMRAELARAPSSVPGNRFEINQRFRTVDLPPSLFLTLSLSFSLSVFPSLSLSLFLSLSLWKICSFLPWDWHIVPYLIKNIASTWYKVQAHV